MVRTKRKTIMIIDDDPGRRKGIYQILKVTGSDLLSAADGEEAMRRIPHEKPELLVVNLYSDEVGGLDFLRELRTYGGGQKIIVFGLVENEEKKRTFATTAGATELLDPDPRPHILVELACKHLGIEGLELPPNWKPPKVSDEEVPTPRARPFPGIDGSKKSRLSDGRPEGQLRLTDDAGKSRKGG